MEKQFGKEMAKMAADHAEYIPNKDPDFDPFAELYTKD
jgi:hypothetical protein